MQVVRNSKRNGRRSGGGGKLPLIIAIVAGAIVLAAIVVGIIVVILLTTGGNNSEKVEEVSSAVSETQDENTDNTSGSTEETIAINPNAATAKTTGKLAYQALYPEMYVPIVEKISAKPNDKVVYLTFDNAPSSETSALLKQLEKSNVKATFFVTANGALSDDARKQIKEIADKGHAVGIYSYSGDKEKIYSSVQDYLDDFALMYDAVYEATGVRPTVFRFPGGSLCIENKSINNELIKEMQRRGFTYYDWNVDPGDNLYTATAEGITAGAINGITANYKSIVILSNAKNNKETVKAISDIIQKAEKAGYRFDVIDPTVKAFSFSEVE